MDTKKMRACAPLLPAPGDEVVIECIDEIEKQLEQLTEAKRIIGEFVWAGDSTPEQRQAFVQRAARFSGVTVPAYKDSGERDERVG